MNRITKENGITLIALVVTIIILLILAGVTVGMATSGTGLFEKAKEATKKYQNAQDLEERILNNYVDEITTSSARSDNYKITTLWQYDPAASSTDVKSGRTTGELTLSDAVTNYDEIAFFGQYYYDSSEHAQATEHRILVKNLTSNPPLQGIANRKFTINDSILDENRRMLFNLSSNNKLIVQTYECYRLLSIDGIKY